jgi:hypothetical protein
VYLVTSQYAAAALVLTGARVGLATEVREKLRVAWVDEADPTQVGG